MWVWRPDRNHPEVRRTRSRSEALAWCVKLVGDNEGEWIESLRGALGAVREARGTGPRGGRQN
jgi:hypothetical protein